MCGNDTALVTDSSEKLQVVVTQFMGVCERRKLKVIVKKKKTKFMRFSRGKGQVSWGCKFERKKT